MNAETLTVRPAASADLCAVREIESASFSDPWTLSAFESALVLPYFRFLVAERSRETDVAPGQAVSTIVGYIIIVSIPPEAEVANVAVRPSHRGAGVGGTLLDNGIATVAGENVKTMYLEVREANVAARKLYESRGFGIVGRRRNYYYKPREDALILRRDSDTD